jgi:hypothetical protein
MCSFSWSSWVKFDFFIHLICMPIYRYILLLQNKSVNVLNWIIKQLTIRMTLDDCITVLTLPHFCACPMLYVMVFKLRGGCSFCWYWWPPLFKLFFFFAFSELRWEVIVHFVAIGGIIDHHCLNFLFIINKTKN